MQTMWRSMPVAAQISLIVPARYAGISRDVAVESNWTPTFGDMRKLHRSWECVQACATRLQELLGSPDPVDLAPCSRRSTAASR